jgi:hypothetical protein
MIDRLPNFIFNIFLSGYTEQESDFSFAYPKMAVQVGVLSVISDLSDPEPGVDIICVDLHLLLHLIIMF